MTEQVRTEIITALSTILVACLGLITAYIRKYLAEKTAALQTDAKLTQTDYYLKKGIELVDIVVKATNQSLVDGIKAAAADGKITNEEAQEIFNTTKNNVMASMTPQIKKSIEEVYGDINNFIQQQIEAAVRDNRLDGAISKSTQLLDVVEPGQAVPYTNGDELQPPPY